MAGAYLDAPSRRMAWDVDGTVVGTHLTGGVASEINATEAAKMQDESNVGSTAPFGGSGSQNWFFLIFPEPREIDGIFAALRVDGPSLFGTFDSSADTTNGIDGTWVPIIVNMTDHVTTYSLFRDNIDSTAVATEKGVRLFMQGGSGPNGGILAFHLYGPISPGETPDRILFLDTTAADAVFTKVLDFGDVPRGQTQTRTFKIKNNSGSLTINTIQVTAEDLYLNAGDWYEFGDDDITYQATFAVGNLGPGATQLLYMKQAIPDAEILGLHTGRIKVSHASLT